MNPVTFDPPNGRGLGGGTKERGAASMTQSQQTSQEPADLLRLDDAEIQALLRAEMDAAGSSPASKTMAVKGAHWMPATILEPSGATRTIRIYPFDIASSGMRAIIGMFLHSGTPIHVTMSLHDGEKIIVKGKVTKCALVSGRAHRAEVRFDDSFDLSLLAVPEGASSGKKAAASAGGAGTPAGGSRASSDTLGPAAREHLRRSADTLEQVKHAMEEMMDTVAKMIREFKGM